MGNGFSDKCAKWSFRNQQKKLVVFDFIGETSSERRIRFVHIEAIVAERRLSFGKPERYKTRCVIESLIAELIYRYAVAVDEIRERYASRERAYADIKKRI